MTAGNDLRATARRLEVAEKRTARQLGKVVNKIALDAARPVVGSDGALGAGGKAKRPRRLRTRTRIYAQPSSVMVIVWGVPAGPWRWINDGTGPHKIRRRRRGPLSHLTVDHPGMSGYGVWDAAEAFALRVVPERFYFAARGAVG